MSDNELRAELASLRAEVSRLNSLLGVEDTGATLHLRCASLTVGSAEGRYGVTVTAGRAGEGDGPALRLTDREAGESGTLATLSATGEGAALALCGRDGVPRVVLAGRDAGGGLSLVDARRDLAAELFGVADASWLALYRGGQPALLTYGIPGGDAVLELYDEGATRRAALPEDCPDAR